MTHISNEQIESEARVWSVQLSSDDIDKAQLEAFNRWHRSSPAHAQAFLKADKVWLSSAKLDHLKAYATLPKPQKMTNPVLRWLQSIGQYFAQLSAPAYAAWSIACVALITLVVSQQPHQATPAIEIAMYSTQQGEVKDIILQDGSIISLGAQSRIQVSFTDKTRQVILAQGHALFEVTHNPERPFIVLTGDTQTRVLGTIFSVKREHDSVDVAVKEGKVSVGKPETASNSSQGNTVLVSGQGVTADHSGNTQSVRSVPLENIGSWKNGRLIFENKPLHAIINHANRYTSKRIILVDQNQADTHLSLSMTISNIDQMVNDITSLLPLKATYSNDTILLNKQQ